MGVDFGNFLLQINNAGMQKYQSESYEDAVDTIETNYFGTRRVTEKLLPMLRASPFGARIVMVSSQVGQMEVNIQLHVFFLCTNECN